MRATNVSLNHDEHKKLERAARKNKDSKAGIMRKLISKFIDDKGKIIGIVPSPTPEDVTDFSLKTPVQDGGGVVQEQTEQIPNTEAVNTEEVAENIGDLQEQYINSFNVDEVTNAPEPVVNAESTEEVTHPFEDVQTPEPPTVEPEPVIETSIPYVEEPRRDFPNTPAPVVPEISQQTSENVQEPSILEPQQNRWKPLPNETRTSFLNRIFNRNKK